MTKSGQETDAKLTPEQLVRYFVSYLKASFVYPPANHRVTEPAEAVISGFKQHRDSRGLLRMCLNGDKFQVNDHMVEIPEGTMSWATKAFTKTAICGVDLGPSLPKESLEWFAKRLQANFQKTRDLEGFQTKWSDPAPGIEPLELLVDGRHALVEGHDTDAILRPPLHSDVVKEAERHGMAPDSKEAMLLGALHQNSGLVGRLDGLRKRLNSEVLNEKTLAGMDILTQMVKTLPAEAFDNAAYANECVEKILAIAEMQIVRMLTTGGMDVEARALDMVASVGRKIFGVSKETGTSGTAEHLPAGRPEDQLFTDDLETLLTEYDGLPGEQEVQLQIGPELKDEVLGILLHKLVSAPDDEVDDQSVAKLSQFVREAEHAKELLGTYVDSCMANRGKTTEQKTHWRVADFIQGHGFASLFGHDDLLRTDTVAFAFPYLFNHFLDSLKWGNDSDLSKIGDVCYGIGPERLRAAKDFLLGENGVLVPSRTRKIFAKPNKDVLPLAEIILEDGSQWITPLATQFLKQMKMPGTASLALRAVHPVSMLSRSYLIDLCRAAYDGHFPEELINQSASLVCRFIRNTADDPAQHERRLYAIQSLRGIRSQETLVLLMELKTVCGPLSLSKELRKIRKAAIEVLDYHGGGQG
ncbi:MAG: hypothetical protein V3U11_00045 [Planctomycetota bacterium]